MRNQLGYQGLTFTDALEMQGVKKYFPDGEASVESLIAGNDMLCLPGDVPLAIEKIKAAIIKMSAQWSTGSHEHRSIKSFIAKIVEVVSPNSIAEVPVPAASAAAFGAQHDAAILLPDLRTDRRSGAPPRRRPIDDVEFGGACHRAMGTSGFRCGHRDRV